MTLNERNRLLKDGTGNVRIPSDIDHDVSMMNEKQLEHYMRFQWTGLWDRRLANEFVWTIPTSGEDSVTAFGRYLAHLRRRADRREEEDNDKKRRVDPKIKERIDKVLAKLIDECLGQKGRPTEEHIAFAQGVVEMAYDIKWYEGGDKSLARQFSGAFERATEGFSDKSLSVAEVISFSEKMKPPELQNPILDLVARIKTDQRYVTRVRFPPFV